MANFSQGVPSTPNQPLVDENRNVTPAWWAFFVSLFERTGGSAGSTSAILDYITDTIGSILYRGVTDWTGLPPGAQGRVLEMGASVPEWNFLTSASFASVGPRLFLAGPVGGAGKPTFRGIATVDLDGIEGQFPGTITNDNAQPGNIGEYLFSEVASGAAIALASGTPSDITSIDLTAGDWDLWANVGLSANPTTVNAWINPVSATDPGAPNEGAYVIFGNQSQVFPLGSLRASLAAPATYYLSLNATFGGALNAYGFMGARRRR